ncbi:hypothetical protein [Sinorhizobium meliloti]|uniref:hypothetical protein n=2 Tax=Rhizobium meliloti TaxID=382 RepID=UPI000FDC551D|nr:hypothetical protein [Sinorhizobium meliloti]RVG89029.1 hypothetical protein CN218_26120 [Sinorhizobium meliloti]RVL60727.1 hypothetical protein CN137_18195 [Sinorhizobium meliloti]
MAKSSRKCGFSGCEKKHYALGYCSAHHTKLRRHGTPEGVRPTHHGEPMAFLLDALHANSRDCIIWPFSRSDKGYARISVKKDGRRRMALASNVICELVHGAAPTPDHEAAHSCGNGHLACVHPDHVRWKMHAENMAEMMEHGRSTRGEKHALAKISEDTVRSIRREFPAVTKRQLSLKYKISPTHVSRIINGERWAHVA